MNPVEWIQDKAAAFMDQAVNILDGGIRWAGHIDTQNEVELLVLQTLLFLLTGAFLIKAVVFRLLLNEMSKQAAQTELGVRLVQHYRSITIQAFIMSFTYLQYFLLTVTGLPALPFWGRMATYVALVWAVLWVAYSGVELIRAYWTVRDRIRDGMPAV